MLSFQNKAKYSHHTDMIVVPFIEYMSVNTLVNWVIKSYTTAD